MFFWRIRIFALLSAVALGGCLGEAGEAGGGVRDDRGETVQLHGPAARIVSLAPPFTELLFAIGAGDRVVGRTRWDADPPPALDVRSVGDGLAPNLEAIVAQRPDLVVFYQSAANQHALERLDALGVAHASFRLDRIEDFRRTVRALARLTDRADSAALLLEAFDRELADASLDRHGSTPSATVLILAWDNPPIVIGGGSFLSELVTLAGARNAFADIAQPSAQVSIETIAARNPDFVLVTGGTSPPPFARRPEWQVVHAVRAKRFVAVEGTEFAWPSFRTPGAVRELRQALTQVVR